MKLLLDEMYPGRLAQDLRERGVDAEGVDERPPLRGLSDEELLVVAAREGRALVSENVADFMRLYGEWGASDRRHAGIVIALSSRFSRTSVGYEVLVDSLVELCSQRPADDGLADAVQFLARS
ncbi:MAG TPA: DUF5615 family PIN-like protein [Solirubrobacterales bacterium]|nr:DUF5615 family PIN-like protein [Solirubrobacterales bacterium]